MVEGYALDYIFIGSKDGLLANETLEVDDAAKMAQVLARKHRQKVTYAEVVGCDIEPDKCANCGDILPPDGVCPCCDFGECEDDLYRETE